MAADPVAPPLCALLPEVFGNPHLFITPETEARNLTDLPDALHEFRADGVATVQVTR